VTQLRREGIYEHNRDFLSNQADGFMRERKMSRKRLAQFDEVDETKLVKICGKCHGVFDENYIRKHRAVCAQHEVVKPAEVKLWMNVATAANNNLRYISMTAICMKLQWPGLCAPGFHAFKGSNYTSAFVSYVYSIVVFVTQLQRCEALAAYNQTHIFCNSQCAPYSCHAVCDYSF